MLASVVNSMSLFLGAVNVAFERRDKSMRKGKKDYLKNGVLDLFSPIQKINKCAQLVERRSSKREVSSSNRNDEALIHVKIKRY